MFTENYCGYMQTSICRSVEEVSTAMSEEESINPDLDVVITDDVPVCPFSEEGTRSGDVLLLIMLVIVPLLLILWLFSLE